MLQAAALQKCHCSSCKSPPDRCRCCVRDRRRYAPSEGRQLDIPPLGMTALTWGLFMGVSSNLRYQAVFGAERIVDKTIARRVPQVHCIPPNLSPTLQGGVLWADLDSYSTVMRSPMCSPALSSFAIRHQAQAAHTLWCIDHTLIGQSRCCRWHT